MHLCFFVTSQRRLTGFGIWHKGLLFNLKEYGINGALLNWISDYLDIRKQKVVIKSCHSNTKLITAGVPKAQSWDHCYFLFTSLTYQIVC